MRQASFLALLDRCRRPELIFGLLVALILSKDCSTTILDSPHVDLRRRPASATALSALGTKDDHPVTSRQDIVYLNSKCTGGEFHEKPEELLQVGMPVIVA